MGQYSFLPKRWHVLINTLCLISTLFITLVQCLVPSVAFASPTASGFTFGTSQTLDLASVSVVRLLVSYTSTESSCVSNETGLGVLVGSWATTSNQADFTNWVLTDGSLVNPNGISCPLDKSTEALTNILIYANNAYAPSSSSSSPFYLKALTCHTASCTDGKASEPILCAISPACEKGVVLLPFHSTAPQPFLDLSPVDQAVPSNGIELTGPSSLPSFYQALQFLTPSLVASTNLNKPTNEPGMPIVNSSGQLVDMTTSQTNTGQFIRDFVNKQLAPTPSTPSSAGHTIALHDDWNQGVTDFYANKLSAAFSDFTSAGKQNTQFQAPAAFLKLPQFSQLAATATASPRNIPNRFGPPVATVTPATSFNEAVITAAAILLIIVLLIIVAIVRSRSRLRQRREYAELERIAEENAARIIREEEEHRKGQQAWQQPIRQQPPINSDSVKNTANVNAQSRPDLRCPNCGTPAQPTDYFCSHCRSPLTLSDSGLHMRLAIPQAQVPPIASPLPQPSPLTQQVPDPTCPNCKQTVPTGASFCANCGFSLSPSAVFQTRVTPLLALDPQHIPLTSSLPVQQHPNLPEEHVQDSSQEIEEAPNRVGQRLGNYQLMQLLGEGGFAEVYLGEHIHLGNQAAIKVLHGQLTSAEHEQFRQEARTLVRLIHPHIVRVLDFGIEDKTPFLVMDYAANGTLRERYPKGTRLPLATIIPYVKQVADALQFAHDQKIIHRDIKPENMLVGQQGEILLSDFGIATVALSSRYQSGQDMAGTIAYMAPEQIQTHPRPASDQYALGVVIYEWLCGTRPFQGSFPEIAVKHAVVPPPSLCEQVPTLPLAAEDVVFKALAKDPHARFASVQALAKALEQAQMKPF